MKKFKRRLSLTLRGSQTIDESLSELAEQMTIEENSSKDNGKRYFSLYRKCKNFVGPYSSEHCWDFSFTVAGTFSLTFFVLFILYSSTLVFSTGRYVITYWFSLLWYWTVTQLLIKSYLRLFFYVVYSKAYRCPCNM